MGKKIVVPCLDVMIIAFYPRNIQLSISLKDHISNTKRVQRIVLMPPGHPIILLKSLGGGVSRRGGVPIKHHANFF